jgi:hypothetical protein
MKDINLLLNVKNKKLFLILFLSLAWSGSVYAKEITLDCKMDKKEDEDFGGKFVFDTDLQELISINGQQEQTSLGSVRGRPVDMSKKNQAIDIYYQNQYPFYWVISTFDLSKKNIKVFIASYRAEESLHNQKVDLLIRIVDKNIQESKKPFYDVSSRLEDFLKKNVPLPFIRPILKGKCK